MPALTKNFSVEELRCNCCLKCDMDKDFLNSLQALRDVIGKPLKITSGFRCLKKNQDIGGSKNSYHTKGRAVDIACTDMGLRYDLVSTATALGFGGIEISPLHVHLDNRDSGQLLMWTDFKKVV